MILGLLIGAAFMLVLCAVIVFRLRRENPPATYEEDTSAGELLAWMAQRRDVAREAQRKMAIPRKQPTLRTRRSSTL